MLHITHCNARRNPLRAELVGSDRCTIPGFTATSATPVLALCRTLIAAGSDPTTRLDCYRGDTLALRVCSIGAAAKLTVKDNRLGRPCFARWQDRAASDAAAPLVAETAPEGAEHRGAP